MIEFVRVNIILYKKEINLHQNKFINQVKVKFNKNNKKYSKDQEMIKINLHKKVSQKRNQLQNRIKYNNNIQNEAYKKLNLH